MLCKLLVDTGHTVINIDRTKKQQPGVTLYPFDIDNSQVDGVIKLTKPDTIIHLAADHEVGRSVTEPEVFYKNNVMNTIGLLNSAISSGVKNFTIGNRGYGFQLNDKVSPVGLVTAAKVLAGSKTVGYTTDVQPFELSVIDTFSDTFYGWQFGQLDYIDEFGCFDSEIKFIEIDALPSPDFSVEDICALDTAYFYNTSQIGTNTFHHCLLYTSPSPRDQRGYRVASCW